MEQTILNPFQKKTLDFFKKTSLSKKFYLSGGTALAEVYLHHRYSEDLDFFTAEELNLEELKRFSNLVAKKNHIQKIEFQHGFGLYTFFMKDKQRVNKIDFGQYPFEPIEELVKFNDIKVESLFDIAVNKAHTIAFRPRLRDFIDLYCILQEKKGWTIDDLLQKSFEKFEMRVDALQLGTNLIQVKTLADMPVMIKKINLQEVQKFFLEKAKALKTEVLK
ncbi:hypothetical protein COV89_02120 [Candidatus Shapirobacteria bacterium CG11_big_fil_rev_8_21_14_0_20_40_12]|uniref:Nucleotidyl transferase AbiEii/AbiGii toxin family protein n=4 Tax=Candidatus Shapironibacteriota TaxID=1752721 RepID=A0A2M8EU65_9BACT|nr:MAG: hypothetical protein COV89_02120 [Candidatus Shapirobacteria bacterium CG11_big_fil_rev_8_21_14_0_20_40_12]PJC28660.1 MAG: hypothetical protein CO053_03460 [Candidatus Shapirobacteria bacterium CG_4_9_14_0_2_um_filter_40_11]PJC77066.1 MAG: hypothetical protein CO010_01055 [Candidatus Shapirobacteria bacterium CG_4_8_14_3_um_filter_39_11]